ncbi:MAG TPA: TonB-dependent receptor [Rhodanobacter sp.]|jgi:hypothetical protein|nr:TonB-dependent receptor [Rhodanobacter sp.]
MSSETDTRRQHLGHRVAYSALSLAIAAACGLYGAGGLAPVQAQASTGSIFGTAPVGAGETVVITSANGLTRSVPVDSSGRFSATSLPLGTTYTVTLQKDGAPLDSRKDIELTVGAGTQVTFVSQTTTLGAVTVSANSLPPIDISQVGSRTVVTSKQLSVLPLQRSAEAIATLAPGVIQGTSYYTGPTGNVLNSFGGSSIAENAYYINGFNTTDPLHGFGGLSLPYGAIDQQQVLTGGYDARYGRTDGGVINQIGKRGTNEWHFGAQVLYQPEGTASAPSNWYYPTGPQYLANADGGAQGQLYSYNHDNKSWVTTYDAYAGGPLIKDKLFFFGAVEANRQSGTGGGSAGASGNTIQAAQITNYTIDSPKWYAKLDWNINDNNILELTGASNKRSYAGNVYQFNYAGDKATYGPYKQPDLHTKDGADLWIAKYTGYLTDNLTVDALFGKMKQTNYAEFTGSDEPFVTHPENQNPAYGGGAIVGPQAVQTVPNAGAHDKTSNLRLDVTYKLGSHDLTAGIDNMNVQALDVGSHRSGPGEFIWNYGKGDPNKPISSQTGQEVAAPGGQGYYVDKHIGTVGAASVRVKQRAEFIEDRWQVTDRILLNLGLRNDQFTNYNPDSVPYLRLTKPQWAPRLGVSWDVHGDSSMKVYANAGRYYLDEPANVAIRGAAGSIVKDQYFTYTGIDPATGAPTGLTQIPQGNYPYVSANNEFGQAPDPKTVTSKNAGAEYQDEYIAGLDQAFQMFGAKWTTGVKASYRHLRRMLDDVCAEDVFANAGAAQGFDPDAAIGSGCYIMNPGTSLNQVSTFNVPLATGGYGTMRIPWSEFGMPTLLRKYLGLDLYLEHQFDGTWYGRIDYTISHSFGNTEGSVRSSSGQTDVAQTVDWDNPGVMTYSGGDQSNDRRHQIKLLGYWQVTPEWLLGANAQILSGTPRVCYGYFGPEQGNPSGYGASYHFCGAEGTPAPPGSTGRTPWQEIVSLNVSYRPAFAEHKLGFSLLVYNLFDQQRMTQFYPTSESGPGKLTSKFWVPIFAMTPRYLQFGITYDF